MNDVHELKRFAPARTRSQGLPEVRCREVLDRIRHDDETAEGSWAAEWSADGLRLERDGRLLDAVRCYDMARYPFVDGPARQEALQHCVRVFDSWRHGQGIERLDLVLPKGRVACWASGLSGSDRQPLLVIMGGLVGLKEQWARSLVRAGRLGVSTIVTEMPGVGENALPYSSESWRMLSAVLDAVADRTDVSRTYVMALGFSGHLALHCAGADPRIRGIVTGGAPIHDFFTDQHWFEQLPRLTVDTLAHLTGTPATELPALLRHGWALTPEELAAVDVPVCYSAATRDEVIPPGEVWMLRNHLRPLRLIEFDDVHGWPRHMAESRLWFLHSLLGMLGVRDMSRTLIGLALGAMRLQRRVAGTQA